jgi:uncharacterized membrane protein YphA (DoxX/SURF4 family)
MSLINVLARPMLGGIFIYGGLDAVRQPQSKVAKAETVVADAPVASEFDTENLVRINGAVQVGAGVALSLSFFPRVASLVLAASLVPTTAAGHRFWEADDDATRSQQTIHFLKNVAIVGGLIFAATDTGGRPSVPWRAKRAVADAAHHALEIVPGSHAD